MYGLVVFVAYRTEEYEVREEVLDDVMTLSFTKDEVVIKRYEGLPKFIPLNKLLNLTTMEPVRIPKFHTILGTLYN